MATLSEGQQNPYDVPRTQRLPFDEIREPGCYINNATGHLFRVPTEALAHGRSPLIEIVSKEGSMMTKVCDVPWIPISKARQLAADADLYVNF
jgi:hypothetical protein